MIILLACTTCGVEYGKRKKYPEDFDKSVDWKFGTCYICGDKDYVTDAKNFKIPEIVLTMTNTHNTLMKTLSEKSTNQLLIDLANYVKNWCEAEHGSVHMSEEEKLAQAQSDMYDTYVKLKETGFYKE